MGLMDLPVELLEVIIDYTIPENWKFYSGGRWILNLRLLSVSICSFHFNVL